MGTVAPSCLKGLRDTGGPSAQGMAVIESTGVQQRRTLQIAMAVAARLMHALMCLLLVLHAAIPTSKYFAALATSVARQASSAAFGACTASPSHTQLGGCVMARPLPLVISHKPCMQCYVNWKAVYL